VKWSAGRSGVALANTNWCAVVVLPQRLLATMLRENSGMPAQVRLLFGPLA
jgi:hypothetical protein